MISHSRSSRVWRLRGAGMLLIVFQVVVLVHSSVARLPAVSVLPIAELRGGTRQTGGKRRKRKKKKSHEVSQAMKNKDSATALGDAIRDRADVLRSDIAHIEDSVSSVGWAMGATDSSKDTLVEEGGGVEAAPTSVLANYFLKSHGGAHAIQCACSLLAVLAGSGAILAPLGSLKLMFLRRALMFAMAKHVSGLVAVASVTAKAIPTIGLREARKWMETLALDPVSQYVFYAALLLLWMPTTSVDTSWWWNPPYGRISAAVIVVPILLREVISTVFVISDVLVLLTASGGGSVPAGLQIGQAAIDAAMSIMVTPTTWRDADSMTRQAILAKLTSRTSLIFELMVGLLLCIDALLSLWQQSFSSNRPSALSVVRRLVCVQLYVNFLWVRKRKIVKLASQVRGGASKVPFYVLNTLLEPKVSMGLSSKSTQNTSGEFRPSSWMDYAAVALGVDN